MRKVFLFLAVLLSSFSFAVERLVSIDGSLTEVVYALDAQSLLVARDDTSVHPKAVFRLPSVGYMRALSTEGVLSVKPTKVLVTDAAGPPNVIKQLQASNVDIVTVKSEPTLAGVRNKIEQVGKALDKPEETKTFLQEYDATTQSFLAKRETIGQAIKGKRALLFLGMQANALNAAGTKTKAQSILDMLGLVNAANHAAYMPLSTEAMISLNPEVIIIATHGPIDKAQIAKQFSFTPAFKHNRIIFKGSAELLSFGPRLPSSLTDVLEQLTSGDSPKETTLANK
ncbi:MAG: ABC transporter substrate-binding protein [Cellvibrionales bacterium]|nr:ABC transporter substrate-binding protein [Cellvibrionales bacterium]